ncbi:MAG: DUF465 domain-containing protein [Sulfurimonadaceae bacterium]|jgi:uncharacterized protein YdcH (DUF465 family)|nr:DUF465 domain-containing protein [Arcobacteraceae bacterium]MDX9796765.1 DUF465 domain-containing protein [Arcobacteraceae bacterium]
MFHEYRDIIVKIKAQDKYFEKLFDKHNEMDEEIVQLEKNHADQFEIEKKKKEKLKLKDDIHTAILKYKKDNNL